MIASSSSKDKRNAIVVLDAKDYDYKMMSILNESTYAEVKQNPTNSVEWRLGDIFQGIRWQGEIEDNMYRWLNPSHSSSPNTYGTPFLYNQ